MAKVVTKKSKSTGASHAGGISKRTSLKEEKVPKSDRNSKSHDVISPKEQSKRRHETQITPTKIKKAKRNLGNREEEREMTHAKRQKTFKSVWDYYCRSQFTAIELEKLWISDEQLLYSDKSIENECERLTQTCPDWAKRPMSKGSPLALCVCASAIRCADLHKVFKTGGYGVAKLFAKHFKINDQAKFLASHAVQIGIGTPTRLAALIEEGHLKLDKLRAVVLDWHHRDQKMRGLPDIEEVRAAAMQLLSRSLVPLINENKKIKLIII